MSLTLAEGFEAVALGIVVSIELVGQTTGDCVLVAIDTALDGLAQLPIQTGELLSISDAVGSQVPWPVQLIRLQPQVSSWLLILHFSFVSNTIMSYYTYLTCVHFQLI